MKNAYLFTKCKTHYILTFAVKIEGWQQNLYEIKEKR